MIITVEIPQELEQELFQEAETINLSLPEYILHILSIRDILNNSPKTGKELVNYWQKEGLINCISDIENSQEYAREIRYQAEHRQHLQ